ncbi:MAG: chalcone isomerase family protein [Burkholderiales bacterium]
MKSRILPLLLAFAAFAAAFSASSAEVAGVKLDDKTRVGNADLTLNGAGLRKRMFFQVYAIGLYLPQKSASPAAILEQPGPKRVAIHMLRDVGADDFSAALADGIRANHSEADARALEPRVQELAAIMAELKEAKKGMAIALDWNGTETRFLAQGKPMGRPIAGEDFYRALLRIWIGDKPVQDDLKKALLGGG